MRRLRRTSWSVIQNFLKGSGFQQDEVPVGHVFWCCGHKEGMCVSISMTLHITFRLLCESQLPWWVLQYFFDDEVKKGVHGVFTPNYLLQYVDLPQTEMKDLCEIVGTINVWVPINTPINQMMEVSSSNMDRNVSWRCYGQNQWTTHLRRPDLVSVEGLWCHVLSVWLWALFVYRGVDSLKREEWSQ